MSDNVGRFHTENCQSEINDTSSERVPKMLVGRRFDRIELACTMRDLCDAGFTEWMRHVLMCRVTDARPATRTKIILDVRP